MKLVDLLVELESKKAVIQDSGSPGFFLDSKSLRNIQNSLFECDEFKNVARINFLDMPTYLVDEETQEPIATNREFLGGTTKGRQVYTFHVNPGQDLKFNKIIDLYTITLFKKYSSNEDIKKPGIWVYPTDYNQETFVPTNQIRVIWDPSQLQDALKLVGGSETPKKRLLRMFETALDSMEPNIPCEYVLALRCSTRSIENSDEIKVVNAEPSKPEMITIDINIPPAHPWDGSESVESSNY